MKRFIFIIAKTESRQTMLLELTDFEGTEKVVMKLAQEEVFTSEQKLSHQQYFL